MDSLMEGRGGAPPCYRRRPDVLVYGERLSGLLFTVWRGSVVVSQGCLHGVALYWLLLPRAGSLEEVGGAFDDGARELVAHVAEGLACLYAATVDKEGVGLVLDRLEQILEVAEHVGRELRVHGFLYGRGLDVDRLRIVHLAVGDFGAGHARIDRGE